MLALALLLVAQVDAGVPAVLGTVSALGSLKLPSSQTRVAEPVAADLEAGPGRSADELLARLREVHAWHACAVDRAPGDHKVTLTVRGNGTVAAASVAAEPKELAACLSGALLSMTFTTSAVPEQRIQLAIHVVEGAAPARVVGSLDKAIIRKTVQAHAPAIRACYERTLASAPDLAGKVKMKWVIAADGTVTQVTVEAAPPGFDAVTECLRGEFATWTFPKPKGGGIVIVNYPFAFKRSVDGPPP